ASSWSAGARSSGTRSGGWRSFSRRSGGGKARAGGAREGAGRGGGRGGGGGDGARAPRPAARGGIETGRRGAVQALGLRGQEGRKETAMKRPDGKFGDPSL